MIPANFITYGILITTFILILICCIAVAPALLGKERAGISFALFFLGIIILSVSLMDNIEHIQHYNSVMSHRLSFPIGTTKMIVLAKIRKITPPDMVPSFYYSPHTSKAINVQVKNETINNIFKRVFHGDPEYNLLTNSIDIYKK
ncbi:MAG: hypothetical protein ACYCTB_11825 [bacterium]